MPHQKRRYFYANQPYFDTKRSLFSPGACHLWYKDLQQILLWALDWLKQTSVITSKLMWYYIYHTGFFFKKNSLWAIITLILFIILLKYSWDISFIPNIWMSQNPMPHNQRTVPSLTMMGRCVEPHQFVLFSIQRHQ